MYNNAVKRAGYWVLGIFLLTIVAAISLTLWYKMSLVHVVVKNAVLQKAPPEARASLESAFEQARAQAERARRSDAYLETLFAISQRVEKVQHLSPEAIGEILRMLQASLTPNPVGTVISRNFPAISVV
ncbi:MAG TPA: hypothetical protein VGL91_05225 [Acidobacteriota bacterium]|jgi:hypothetical protein